MVMLLVLLLLMCRQTTTLCLLAQSLLHAYDVWSSGEQCVLLINMHSILHGSMPEYKAFCNVPEATAVCCLAYPISFLLAAGSLRGSTHATPEAINWISAVRREDSVALHHPYPIMLHFLMWPAAMSPLAPHLTGPLLPPFMTTVAQRMQGVKKMKDALEPLLRRALLIQL